jgi:hypothetical protein
LQTPADVERPFTVPKRIARLLTLALAGVLSILAQTIDPLAWQDKLRLHPKAAYAPESIAGLAAYAGFLQMTDSPRDWGGGAGAYGMRFASAAGSAGIHGALAFGLDATLNQDPRYFRAGAGGLLRRFGHALRGTFLTRTDTGGETFSTWRVGSAYGAAFLSNTWYPARLDNARAGLTQGSIRLGFDFASNLAAEFWPDFKQHLCRRK